MRTNFFLDLIVERQNYAEIFSKSVNSGVAVTVEPVREGSERFIILEISERSTTVAEIILTCSGLFGLSLDTVGTPAILSRVSKLDSVTILPKTVYCSSRKCESL